MSQTLVNPIVIVDTSSANPGVVQGSPTTITVTVNKSVQVV